MRSTYQRCFTGGEYNSCLDQCSKTYHNRVVVSPTLPLLTEVLVLTESALAVFAAPLQHGFLSTRIEGHIQTLQLAEPLPAVLGSAATSWILESSWGGSPLLGSFGGLTLSRTNFSRRTDFPLSIRSSRINGDSNVRLKEKDRQ